MREWKRPLGPATVENAGDLLLPGLMRKRREGASLKAQRGEMELLDRPPRERVETTTKWVIERERQRVRELVPPPILPLVDTRQKPEGQGRMEPLGIQFPEHWAG